MLVRATDIKQTFPQFRVLGERRDGVVEALLAFLLGNVGVERGDDPACDLVERRAGERLDLVAVGFRQSPLKAREPAGDRREHVWVAVAVREPLEEPVE